MTDKIWALSKSWVLLSKSTCSCPGVSCRELVPRLQITALFLAEKMVFDGDPSAVGLVALAALAGALGNAIDPVAVMAWIHPVTLLLSAL